MCFWLYAPSFDKIGSPRCSCSRSSQGCSHSSTTDRTSNRCCGCHRTGQGRTLNPLSCFGSSNYFMSEILPRNCRLVSPVHPISNIMEFLFLYQDTRRVNPPNLPLRRGNPLRSSPAATQQQAVCKKGSPRRACARASQGSAQSSTTDRTSNRGCGSHRTGQLSHPRR